MSDTLITPTEPLDEKLSRVTFVPAPEPHIVLDPETCAQCGIERICLTICPAGNFRLCRHGELHGMRLLPYRLH